MTGVLNELRHQPLLWLLVFVPVVFVVEASAPEAHTALFGLAILAIVPLAALLSHATESVAANRKSKSHAELRITKHLMPAFGNKPLSITTAHVQAYSASRLEAGAAGATINRELCVLKLAFRLMDVPKPRIEMLKESDPRTRFFEADQIAAVVQHLPAPLRAVVLFLYFSGWRKSEALSRQMRHVDFNACTVRLEPGETKNSKGRVLKFDQMPELKAVLEAQRDEHERLAREGRIVPWLFHRDGKPILSLDSAWRTVCKRAGVPGRLLHDLRRTAVRDLIRAGVSQTVAMKQTGHLTASVFSR